MALAELATWSMALGAIGALALARLAEAVAHRGARGDLRGAGYHLAVAALVLVESGLLAHLLGPPAGLLHALQVLAGPCCVGLSNRWLRGWLGADRRDALMDATLRGSAVALPLAGAACLALPVPHQLPAAGALALAGAGVTLWLTARAWLAGDALAPLMAAGCACTLPAIAGLYATAAGLGSPAQQAAWAACAVASSGFTGGVLWQRERTAQRAATRQQPGPLDPVTQLPCGTAFGRLLVQAEARRQRMRRGGALLAVQVFELERLVPVVGRAGVHELLMALAARLQHRLGAVDPVGRYAEACFVGYLGSVRSAAWARALGVRLAAELRRPVDVRGFGAERVRVHPDVALGLVRLRIRHMAVEDMLADGQHLARLARQMRGRAATFDEASGAPVPLELAQGAARPVPVPWLRRVRPP